MLGRVGKNDRRGGGVQKSYNGIEPLIVMYIKPIPIYIYVAL